MISHLLNENIVCIEMYVKFRASCFVLLLFESRELKFLLVCFLLRSKVDINGLSIDLLTL